MAFTFWPDRRQTYPNPNKLRLAGNSRTVVARKDAGQRRSINERLGLGVFESRTCRFVNRCPPESKTGERLVYNTAFLAYEVM